MGWFSKNQGDPANRLTVSEARKGMRVFAVWPEDGWWYRATITAVEESRVQVTWDDGGGPLWVPLETVASPKLEWNAKVECRWSGNDLFYQARIQALDEWGPESVQVRFSMDGVEEWRTLSQLRLKDALVFPKALSQAPPIPSGGLTEEIQIGNTLQEVPIDGHVELIRKLSEAWDHEGVIRTHDETRAAGVQLRVPEVLHRVGAAYHFGRNDHATALRFFQEALTLEPDDSNLHSFSALCHYYLGDLEACIREAQRALELDDQNQAALKALMLGHAKSGQMDQAERYLAMLEGMDGGMDALNWNEVGFLYHDHGYLDKAIACYRKALQLEPAHPVLQENLQLAETHKNRFGGAAYVAPEKLKGGGGPPPPAQTPPPSESQAPVPSGEPASTPSNAEGEPASEEPEPVESILGELDRLVGMEAVKRDIRDLLQYLRMEQLRREQGLPANEISLHTIFTGPPGTGKTTFARMLGRILRSLGLLEKGHVVEVDRSKLVSPNIGGTAPLTNGFLDQALGGILFIDEAYTLKPERSASDFGQEAIDTILKRMEDDRGRLVVVAAGYREEMERFIESNPGLESRFNRRFHFDDYTPQELLDLFRLFASDKEYRLEEEAEAKLLRYFTHLYQTRGKAFGNGRLVRNKLEEIIRIQSTRAILQMEAVQDPDARARALVTITLADVEKAVGGEFQEEKEETLEEILSELSGLVGMEAIKEDIENLLSYLQVNQKKEELGLPVEPLSLHCAFYGPPGTGKTTVARILGRVFKMLGILKKGHVVEVDRSDLVGEFIGQTEQKTQRALDRARHGILFIDEAYALTQSDSKNDFGKQAVDAILKRMEDERGTFSVVVAGYPQEMKRFIDSNPGLESRFTRHFRFDDYEPQELLAIFRLFAEKGQYTLEPSALELLSGHFQKLYDRRDGNFGNGRLVRNAFEKVTQVQSSRVVKLENPTREALTAITMEDVAAMIRASHDPGAKAEPRPSIGF